tara:strand:+ start:399 stop:605 length:207 start_codon:yes stop_codon:yes gene_type:complete
MKTNHIYHLKNGGLTFPGIIDEPGAIAGRLISESPVRGPEDNNLRSLETRVSSRDRFLKLEDKETMSF